MTKLKKKINPKKFRIMFGLILLVLLSILVFVKVILPQRANAAWAESTFSYRAKITVTNSGSAQTNYPVDFKLDTATLITAGKMQSDCDDIRIYNIEGQKLAHSVEVGPTACNTAQTIIWVSVPNLPTTGETLYVYYGNPGAANDEHASRIFDEYDLTTFTKVDAGTALTVNSSQQLTITNMTSNSDTYLYKSITARPTGTLDFVVKRVSGGTKVTCTGVGTNIDDCLGATGSAYMIWPWGGFFQGFKSVGFVHTANITAESDSTVYYATIKYDGTNATFYVYSDALRATLLSSQAFTYSSSFNVIYAAANYNDGSASTINDNIYNYHLRGYTATEPTTANATEESNPAPSAALYWKFDEGQGQTINDGTSNSNSGVLGATSASASDDPTWATEDTCVSIKCLKFDGTNDIVTGSKIIGGVKTVAFWVKPNTIATQGLVNLDGGTHKISTNGSGVITATGWSSPTYYINGAATATPTLIQNQWNYVEITTATAFNSTSSFTVGTDGTNFIKGFIDEFKAYNYARSADQVKLDYNNGASAVLGAADQKYLSNGLVGYWKMDESATPSVDSSGNGYSGTWNGNVAASTTAKFNKSLVFDGNGDYLSTADIDLTSFTIAGWVYPTSTNAYQTIVGKNGSYAVTLDANGTGFLRVFLTDGVTPVAVVDATSALTTNTWQHIAVTYDGKTVTLYKNGSQITQSAQTTVLANVAASTLVGLYNTGDPTEAWAGSLDEIRIYNRAFSANDVRSLYNWGPGPVAYLNFDENTGTATNDSSTFGNVGTAVSSTWVPGKFGSALSFNGSTSYVSVADSSSLELATNLTVQVWVKTTDTNADYGLIRKDTASGTRYLYGLKINPTGSAGKVQAEYYNGVTYAAVSTTTINDGVWHNVAMTISGTTLTVYVDGVSQATATISGTQGLPNGELDVGANPPTVGPAARAQFFTGSVDDVKIYNYARTSSQIIEDMNAGHPVGGSPLGSQLIYWKMDEQNGSTLNNSGFGGSTLNGTTSGTTWLTNTTCKVNGCLNLDATSDNVAGGTPTFFNGLNGMTVSLWMNPQTLGSNNSIVSKLTGADNAFQIRTVGTNQLRLVISNAAADNSNYCTTNDTNVIATGSWQHFVFTYDGTATVGNNIRIYKNGVLLPCTVTGTIPSSIRTSAAALRVGANAGGGNGLISYYDEVKIYNAPLTASQVLIDYNQGASINYNTGAALESAALTDGTGVAPVAYWNFEENTGQSLKDISGGGSTGTLGTNSSVGTDDPLWAAGKYGSGLKFDGSNDFVTFGTNILTPKLSGASAVTAEAWFKSTNTGSSGRIISVPIDTTNTGILLRVQAAGGGVVDVQARSTSTDGNLVATGPVISANTWYHLVGVADFPNDKIYVYLNGVLVNTTSVAFGANTYTPGTPSIADTIGDKADSTEFFTGTIDEVKLYNYARTPAQIAYDYNRGGPIGWWKMDQNVSGNAKTIYDSSGQGFNGTTDYGANTTGMDCTVLGKFNYGCNFDGTDDAVTISNNAIFNPTTALSLSVWINPTRNDNYIMGNPASNANWGYYSLTTSSAKLLLGFYNGSGTSTFTSTSSLSLNVWTHVVVVHTWGSGSLTKMYFNGVDAGGSWTSGTGNETSSCASTCQLEIGHWFGTPAGTSNGYHFSGYIDDARIYNYALSLTQVKQIMNNGAGFRYGPVSGTPVP